MQQLQGTGQIDPDWGAPRSGHSTSFVAKAYGAPVYPQREPFELTYCHTRRINLAAMGVNPGPTPATDPDVGTGFMPVQARPSRLATPERLPSGAEPEKRSKVRKFERSLEPDPGRPG